MLSDSHLDYRFGWRWLLPLLPDDKVLLLGFSNAELAFWYQVLPVGATTENSDEASVWLVNKISPSRAANLNASALRCLSVVGTGKMITEWYKLFQTRFDNFSEYSLLPANNPRIVLPLASQKGIVQGLQLHRPGRRIARCAVSVLKLLAQCGIHRPLRNHMLSIAVKGSAVRPHGTMLTTLEPETAYALSCSAMYLGSPDENRKTVVMPVNIEQQHILKQGYSTLAKADLHQEADALRVISQTRLAPQIPVLVDVMEKNGAVTLIQEYRPRQNISKVHMRRATTNFLVELSKIGRTSKPLKDLLPSLFEQSIAHPSTSDYIAKIKVSEWLDRLANQGTDVYGHRSHGDFAPWNYSWTEKGFFVYDWEESLPWEIALSDVFYSIVGPALHVARSPVMEKVKNSAFSLAANVVHKAALPIKDVRLYWGLWLLYKTTVKPTLFYEHLLENFAASLS